MQDAFLSHIRPACHQYKQPYTRNQALSANLFQIISERTFITQTSKIIGNISKSGGAGTQGVLLSVKSNEGSAFLLSGNSIYVQHPASVDIIASTTLYALADTITLYLQVNGKNIKSIKYENSSAHVYSSPASIAYSFNAVQGDRINLSVTAGGSGSYANGGTITVSGIVQSD